MIVIAGGLVYILICVLIGLAGIGKTVGFWGAFFLSLLLSPLIGLIIALVSGSKKQPAPIINNVYHNQPMHGQPPVYNQQQQQMHQQQQSVYNHQQQAPKQQQMHQQQQPPAYQQQPVPPANHQPAQQHHQPVQNNGTDKYAQLEKLAEMKSKGILTEAEFQVEKEKILKS